jgi:hypothetical protein
MPNLSVVPSDLSPTIRPSRLSIDGLLQQETASICIASNEPPDLRCCRGVGDSDSHSGFKAGFAQLTPAPLRC